MTGRITTIIKSGDHLAVTLPEEMLDLLGLEAGEEDIPVLVSRELGQTVLVPVHLVEAAIDTEYVRQVDDFIRSYHPALEALA